MLSRLHVENYVLIDSLDIEFPEGLVIITGETGAGKSILLGALSLLVGTRADAGVIGPHGDNCVVEAEFDVEEDTFLETLAAEHDLPLDGGRLLIRRTLSRSGRSRAFVNDEPVSAAVLQQLSARLVDIHSQHQTRLLTDRAFQLEMLDAFAGQPPVRAEIRAVHARLQALRREAEEAEEALRRSAAEREFNAAQYERLAAARLRDGELEELEAEQRQLANAGQIKEAFGRVAELFDPSDGERMSLDALLKDAGRTLGRVSAYVPGAEPLVGRLESARLELEDIRDEAAALDAGIELSGSRLAAVEERLSLLYGLLQKHGCSDVAGLIALRDALGSSLDGEEDRREQLAQLRGEIARTGAEYDRLAAALSAARAEAAPAFAASIAESLRSLELEKAVFEVELSPAPDGPTGRDAVRFLFSAAGTAPADVARCASGGELSRIMLSLRATMARYTDMPTLIFDEIDTGVSGSAADKMGGMIARMGADMQVFAITHLPQVAAKGSAHYLVTKQDAVTSIRPLSGEERVLEIARMLSGARITDAAVENARALLS